MSRCVHNRRTEIRPLALTMAHSVICEARGLVAAARAGDCLRSGVSLPERRPEAVRLAIAPLNRSRIATVVRAVDRCHGSHTRPRRSR